MAESKANLPASHAILLSVVLASTFGVVTVGGDVILDKQSELSNSVVVDEFIEWDNELEKIYLGGDPVETYITFPNGVHNAEKGGVVIEIQSDAGKSADISGTQMSYSPRGSQSQVIYESGLVSQTYRRTGTPVIKHVPDQTYYQNETGSDKFILKLYEQRIDSSTGFGSVYSREFNYIVYPNNKSASHRREYDSSTSVNITVESTNYRAWDEYFNRSRAFTNETMTPAANKVKADVESDIDFKVHIDRVDILHPKPPT